MKLLLENWRKYSLLAEQQLLIEGRISDTKLKYPELAKNREELDGENILDVLIDADPSGNQKYLMGAARILFTAMKDAEKMGDGNKPFWGKAWPEDAPDDIYSPWGLAKNIASSLQKYHDIMPYIRDHDAPFKDINNIKTYTVLKSVTDTARRTKANQDLKKKVEEELKKAAKESTEFVAKTPYHLVVRPLSKEASCHWGMGTKWCISSTKSQNYFDQYTSEGAAFFFLLAKRKEIDPAYKKIAVVLDSEGEFEEYFDTEDNNISLQEFITAVSQAITGVPTGDEIASMEESEPYEVETIRKGLEPFKGQRGFDFDADDDINNVAALFRDTFLDSYIDELKEAARTSVEEAPAGTPDEAYEDALRERVFDYVDVTLSFPSETGADFVHWQSRLWIDVDSIIQDVEGWEVVMPMGRVVDDYTSAVEAALHNINIYVESVESDWGDQGSFHVTVDTGAGSLDAFESFLTDAEWTDRQFSGEFQESFIEQLEERGLIINPEKAAAEKAEKEEAARQKTRDAEYWPDREEKKKQLDLPLQENRIRLKIIKNR